MMARGLEKGLLKRLALPRGVCIVHTDHPVMVYTQVFALYEHLGITFYI
jgi:hypothetical protein